MKNILTTADAAKILKIERKAVITLLEQGHIQGKKVGRGWMVNPESVIAYQQKYTESNVQSGKKS